MSSSPIDLSTPAREGPWSAQARFRRLSPSEASLEIVTKAPLLGVSIPRGRVDDKVRVLEFFETDHVMHLWNKLRRRIKKVFSVTRTPDFSPKPAIELRLNCSRERPWDLQQGELQIARRKVRDFLRATVKTPDASNYDIARLCFDELWAAKFDAIEAMYNQIREDIPLRLQSN